MILEAVSWMKMSQDHTSAVASFKIKLQVAIPNLLIMFQLYEF